METSLNKSVNFFRCVGTVYETAFKRESCEVQIWKDGQNTGKKVAAECIKGSFAVRAGEYGIITFGVYFASKGLDGETSNQWKMATDMLGLNPEVNGNGNSPTLVTVEGRIEGNLFVTRQGTVAEGTRFRVSKVSTNIKNGAKEGMAVKLTGCMTKIAPETKMVDGEAEETGRSVMTTYVANNKGEVFPVSIIIPEDIVDDVNDAVENGCTVEADIDVNAVTFGTVTKKRAIGHATAVDTSNVSTRYEYIMAGMDTVDEPDELYTEDEDGNQIEIKTNWMNPVAVKKAIKAYNLKKEQMEKNGGAPKKATKSISERKAEFNKSKRVGKPKEDFDGFDDDFASSFGGNDDSDDFL